MTVIEHGGPKDDVGPLYVCLDGVYFHRAPVRPGPQPRGYVVECVPADQLAGAVEEAYARGISAAMDVIRAHDFPFTERVDLIAERLAPTVTRGQPEDPGARPLSGHAVRAVMDAQSVVHDASESLLRAEVVRLTGRLTGAVAALAPFAALAALHEQFGSFSDAEWTRVKDRTLRHAAEARAVVRGQSDG